MELTETIIEKLCSYVRLGANSETAALAEGIPESTLEAWVAQGESDPSSLHADFVHRLNQAKAQGEILHIQRIVANGGPGESKWVLERMYPEKRGVGRRGTVTKQKPEPEIEEEPDTPAENPMDMLAARRFKFRKGT